MKVYLDLDSVPVEVSTVLSIGKYDGIHLGHQEIIREIVWRARKLGATSLIITFAQPVCSDEKQWKMSKPITSVDEKLQILHELGVEAVLILPFSQELRSMSGEEFVSRVLVERLRVLEVHEGIDFRFGRAASSSSGDLLVMGRRHNFNVVLHRSMCFGGTVISSTKIRELIAVGESKVASRMLGRSLNSGCGASTHGNVTEDGEIITAGEFKGKEQSCDGTYEGVICAGKPTPLRYLLSLVCDALSLYVKAVR